MNSAACAGKGPEAADLQGCDTHEYKPKSLPEYPHARFTMGEKEARNMNKGKRAMEVAASTLGMLALIAGFVALGVWTGPWIVVPWLAVIAGAIACMRWVRTCDRRGIGLSLSQRVLNHSHRYEALVDAPPIHAVAAEAMRILDSETGKELLDLVQHAEQHDRSLVERQMRVSYLAVAIAAKMHLSEDRTHGLWVSALLHDIGLIAINGADKAGESQTKEPQSKSSAAKHPEIGSQALAKLGWPWPVAKIVLQHHERLDGTGYPARTQGDRLLVESRILAAADDLDTACYRDGDFSGSRLDVALTQFADKGGAIYGDDVVAATLQTFGISSKGIVTSTGKAKEIVDTPNILLIDDEPEMGRSVERVLEAGGEFNVSVAYDGPSGFKAARNATPDLILLDILMPGMDGIETLRTLKGDDRTRSIPVVMVTAVKDKETMRTAMYEYPEQYLVKPVVPDDLRRVVRSRLLAQTAHMAHAAQNVKP